MYHIFLIRSDVRLPPYHSNTRGIPKTAFATKSGKWHWNINPFSTCLLPSVFCYLMSLPLSGLDFCSVYLDNILVYSASWKEYKEHLQHLNMIFNHLKEVNFKIKLCKCHFLKKHLQYLGHLISSQSIHPLSEKVTAIEKLKDPSNIDELHHFLSLTGYYSLYCYLPT